MSRISRLTVSVRSQTAGILAYPPKMTEVVTAWLTKRYATYAAFNSADLLDYFRERIETTEGERKRDAEKSLKEHEAVLRLAKSDGARGKPKKVTRKKFKVDLSGLPANYPKVSPFKDITVVAEVTLDREIGGTWHRDSKILTVKFTGRPPENVAEYQFGLKKMRKTLTHELRHMVQDVMHAYQIDLVDKMLEAQGRSISDLSPKEVTRLRKMVTKGNPKEYDSWQYEGLKGKEEYFLDPQEFFTWLGQSEFEFLNAVRANRSFDKRRQDDPDWDPKPTKAEFDNFVGNPKPVKGKGFARTVGQPLDTHEFFAALWKHDKKRWQRAVKELWKRVQGKLSRKADDLVLRHLTGGYSFGLKGVDFGRAYELFKRDYEATYRELTKQFSNLAELAKIDYPPMLTSAFDVYINGRNLAHAVLTGKEIPTSKIKKFEKAYKTFNRVRRLKSYTKWFAKDLKLIQLLLESNQWPDKGTTEERSKQIGSFQVTNQVGGDMKASEKILLAAAQAIRSSGVPSASKVLYGDVYVVGDIKGKRSVAAFYDPSTDDVFLLFVKRFSGKHEHTLIHEFGHRLWTKFLSKSVKSAWFGHDSNIKHRTVDYNFPKVGDPVEGVRGSPKVVEYKGNKIHLDDGSYITPRQFSNFMQSQGTRKNYPTPYSAKNPEEHFCEAFALYCLGSLPEPHKTDFEAIVVKG